MVEKEQLNPDAKPTFGQVMKDLRTREGLTKRKLAAGLGIDPSTIGRLEVGTRLPPRNAEFYERLRNIPGLTDEDIARLLHAERAPWLLYGDVRGVPRWLSELHHGIIATDPNLAIREPTQISVENITVFFQLEADTRIFSPDEIESIESLTKQVIELRLKSYVQHKAAFRKIINQSLLPLNKNE